jgi:hypothetical protein
MAQKKEVLKLKRSVFNLDLEKSTLIEKIEEKEQLYKFDMNKALDSDDEYNMVKRRSRTKPMLLIIRPWQN